MATRKSPPSARGTTKAIRTPKALAPKKTIKAAAFKPIPAAPPTAVSLAPAAPAKTKQKLVRDSFTIPKSEYGVLQLLKQRALRLSHPAKKSEILRAGISALSAMSDLAFSTVLDTVPSLKTGRPKKDKQAAAGKSGKKVVKRPTKKS